MNTILHNRDNTSHERINHPWS